MHSPGQAQVQYGGGVSGWVAQSLPVDWNVMPGMLDLHVVRRAPRHR